MWRTRDWDALWTWLPSILQWNSGVCCQENQASCPWRFPSHLYSGPTRGLWLVGQTGKQTRSLHGYLSVLAIINSHPSQEDRPANPGHSGLSHQYWLFIRKQLNSIWETKVFHDNSDFFGLGVILQNPDTDNGHIFIWAARYENIIVSPPPTVHQLSLP